MSKRVEAHINNEVLQWVRTDLGYSIEEFAKTIPVDPQIYEEWEKGTKHPTFKQLLKLSKKSQKPYAYFYRTEPPKKSNKPKLQDFRKTSPTFNTEFSSNLNIEISRAVQRRYTALELLHTLKLDLPKFKFSCSIEDDPTETALKLRDFLEVPFNQQYKCKDKYKSLNLWMNAVEKSGVLVFQTGKNKKISKDEMKGVAIYYEFLPIILINSNDYISSKIFTLIHETVHLGLRMSSISIVSNVDTPSDDIENVEFFCNRVAGELLVPKYELLSEESVVTHSKNESWNSQVLMEIAQKYGVSQEVILRRLLDLGKTSKEHYNKFRENFYKNLSKVDDSDKELKIPYFRFVKRNNGSLYTNLVINSFRNELITLSEACDFLNTKTKHVLNLSEKI